jgi:hypothetical protein
MVGAPAPWAGAQAPRRAWCAAHARGRGLAPQASGAGAPRRLLLGPPRPRPSPPQTQAQPQCWRQQELSQQLLLQQQQRQQGAASEQAQRQALGRLARFRLAALPWVAGLRRLMSNGTLSLELAQRSDLSGALAGRGLCGAGRWPRQTRFLWEQGQANPYPSCLCFCWPCSLQRASERSSRAR